MTLFPKTIASDIQSTIAQELSADPYLSSVPVYAENRRDIEFVVKNALGRQGIVAVVMTPELKFAGTYERKSLAWEATDLEIDAVENVTVNRGKLSGDIVTGQDYIMRAFDVLCPLSGEHVGRFCPVDYRQGEDGGLLVNRGRLKCLAHIASEPVYPTSVRYLDGTLSSYDIQGIFYRASIYDMSAATELTVGTGITAFGGSAFAASKLSTLTVPRRVETIGPYAFAGCMDLTGLVFEGRTMSEVSSMDNYPWYLLYNTEISCTDGVLHTVGPYDVTKFLLADGTVVEKVVVGELTYEDVPPYSPNGVVSCSLGNPVTAIGHDAFRYQGLTNILVPATVLSVGSLAFVSNTSMTAATVRSKEIGEEAFYGCNNLSAIRFGDLEKLGKEVFNTQQTGGSGKLLSVELPSTLTAANGWSEFGQIGFVKVYGKTYEEAWDAGITTPVLGYAGEAISAEFEVPETRWYVQEETGTQVYSAPLEGTLAYGDIPGLDTERNPTRRIEIGTGITKIGSSALWNSHNVRSISLPSTLVEIADEAFSDSGSIENMWLPESCGVIGRGAFELMLDLNNLWISAEDLSIGQNAFSNMGQGLGRGPTTVWFLKKTMDEVQALDNYPWTAPSGTVFRCTDGDITI